MGRRVSWRAVFVDGPLEGKEHDRLMMGKWQRELRFCPDPSGSVHDGWMLVGTDAFNDHWPGQIDYVRNDSRSSLIECEPGEDEGFAIYELKGVPMD